MVVQTTMWTIVENGVKYRYLAFGGLFVFLLKTRERPLTCDDFCVVGQTHVGTQPVLLIKVPQESLQDETVEGVAIPIRDVVRLLLEGEEIEKLIRVSASADPPADSEEKEKTVPETLVNETVLSYKMAMPLCLALRKWKRTPSLNSLLLDESTGFYPTSFRPLLRLLCDELFGL